MTPDKSLWKEKQTKRTSKLFNSQWQPIIAYTSQLVTEPNKLIRTFYDSLIMIINNNFNLRSLVMLTTWNFTVFLVSALHCRASKSLSSYVVIIKWLLLPKSSWSCLATLVLDGMCIHENLAFVPAGTLTAHVTCILWPSQDSTDIDELNLSIKRSEKNKAHNRSEANICLYI